ncbi:MAG: type II toxin-antitoxin system Phd/YefM family antitoxin [Beijerinckiaceae bacterium]
MTRGSSREKRKRPPARHSADLWKLEDAKARFSEVVRLARSRGPQTVSVRGENAVVVISVEELERLKPASSERKPLVPFLEGLRLEGLDTARVPDRGRDVEL